ncbi:MAG: FG-GAP repeat domain-containing protein, partial [Planctomycetota bacterium]
MGTNDDTITSHYSNGTIRLKWSMDHNIHRTALSGLSSPAVADINNDSTYEILIGGQRAEAMGGDKRGYVWVYNIADGSELWSYYTGESSIYSSPVVEDIDGDGDYEVLIGSNNNELFVLHGTGGLNWSKSFGGSKVSTVAVGDVNEDGDPEIVVSSSDGKIHILRGNGSEITWMQTGGIDISSPTLADLDNDGDLEIITGSKNGKVYAWHGDGSPVNGWPAQAGPIWSLSPAVGDLDLDGLLEVVVVTKNNEVYAFNGDGTLLQGFPLTPPERKEGSSPALADLDGDGKLEIILGASYH